MSILATATWTLGDARQFDLNQVPQKQLQIVLPFYEGILISDPANSLPDAGLAHCQLCYPGPLAAPFVAWRLGDDDWTVIYAESLQDYPFVVSFNSEKGRVGLDVTGHGLVKQLTVAGPWESMAHALRRKWDVKRTHGRLADHFDQVRFYVHQWIADTGEPIRMDWSAEQLVEEMPRVSPRAIVHLYGLDPGGVDLGGRYLWSAGAEEKAKRIIAANPKVSHLAWLNLRTYKTDIPRISASAPATQSVLGMAKLFDRKVRHDDNYSYRAIDMCLASDQWQAGRTKELEKLIDVGFKVIQLDEFPIAPVWHVSPCSAKDHDHRPADQADEWTRSIAFIAKLAATAERRNVFLTSEEPSAALLPFTAGYIDRQYNDSIEIYGSWKKSSSIRTAPIFSTMFGDLVTPYTDIDGADPARIPPDGWLTAHKIVIK